MGSQDACALHVEYLLKDTVKKMKFAQSALRLTAARTSIISRRTNVSMKQPYDTGVNKGLYPSHPGYDRVRQLQQEWAKTPELMVWQKRGAMDSVPFYLTYATMLIG